MRLPLVYLRVQMLIRKDVVWKPPDDVRHLNPQEIHTYGTSRYRR